LTLPTDINVAVTAAEKTEQRKSEEGFLKAARDGCQEAVASMVIPTSSRVLSLSFSGYETVASCHLFSAH